MQRKTIQITQELADHISNMTHLGDTVEDVLRQVFKMPPLVRRVANKYGFATFKVGETRTYVCDTQQDFKRLYLARRGYQDRTGTRFRSENAGGFSRVTRIK